MSDCKCKRRKTLQDMNSVRITRCRKCKVTYANFAETEQKIYRYHGDRYKTVVYPLGELYECGNPNCNSDEKLHREENMNNAPYDINVLICDSCMGDC